MTGNGPFESWEQARQAPAVQAIYKAAAASASPGSMAYPGAMMLEDACREAGVETGAYDRRILAWVAGFEPEICAVIAGLIRRAAGKG